MSEINIAENPQKMKVNHISIVMRYIAVLLVIEASVPLMRDLMYEPTKDHMVWLN